MSDHNKSSSSNDSLALPYSDFDILLPDINERKLELIGRMCRRENLSSGTFSDPAFPTNGRIHGLNTRYMIPLMCQLAGKPNLPSVYVVFLVGTGSPYTCLTQKTLNAVCGTENVMYAQGEIKLLAIQDKKSQIECRVSKDHYAEVNILGADAMHYLKLSIIVDWKTKDFMLQKFY